MSWKHSVLAALLVLAAAVAPARAQRVELDQIKQPVIEERLGNLSRKLAERRATLEKFFEQAGCTADSLASQKVRGSREPNVICTLKGQDPEAGVIVVGGHFDLITAGMGAVDDWSGAVMLPSLYESLKSRPRRHDFVFVAFAAEEMGLDGSRVYVNALTKPQRAAIRAMINLECLGLASPKIWGSHADPRLLEAYARIASLLHIQPGSVNIDQVGDDDSHSFRDAKIPTLTIHSITQETFPILHTSRDNIGAIDVDQYYAAYRLTATLLAYVDSFGAGLRP